MQFTYLSIRKFVVLSMQLVYFSSSKPAPKNAQTPFYASSNTMGYLANCPPSPFGEGWGEAVFVLPPLSERAGERLLRVCFRLFEILLQTVRCYCSQINSLSLKTAFVTFGLSVSYKQACKRCPFALQNMPFYTSKDALLHCKRACFTTQKGVDGKTERKEIDKKEASPSPSEGGDVRGNGRRRRLTTALRKEGMCLAGYGMLGVGEMEGGRIKAKSSWVNSQRSKL